MGIVYTVDVLLPLRKVLVQPCRVLGSLARNYNCGPACLDARIYLQFLVVLLVGARAVMKWLAKLRKEISVQVSGSSGTGVLARYHVFEVDEEHSDKEKGDNNEGVARRKTPMERHE